MISAKIIHFDPFFKINSNTKLFVDNVRLTSKQLVPKQTFATMVEKFRVNIKKI